MGTNTWNLPLLLLPPPPPPPLRLHLALIVMWTNWLKHKLLHSTATVKLLNKYVTTATAGKTRHEEVVAAIQSSYWPFLLTQQIQRTTDLVFASVFSSLPGKELHTIKSYFLTDRVKTTSMMAPQRRGLVNDTVSNTSNDLQQHYCTYTCFLCCSLIHRRQKCNHFIIIIYYFVFLIMNTISSSLAGK